MTTLAMKMHAFAHPSHRHSTRLDTAPTADRSTGIRTIQQAAAVAALIAGSLGASLLALLTPPTAYASRVLALEHAQDLAAVWQASHHGVGTQFDSPMMRQWLLAPPVSVRAPTPGAA